MDYHLLSILLFVKMSRIQIVGHSFVRRLDSFIRKNDSSFSRFWVEQLSGCKVFCFFSDKHFFTLITFGDRNRLSAKHCHYHDWNKWNEEQISLHWPIMYRTFYWIRLHYPEKPISIVYEKNAYLWPLLLMNGYAEIIFFFWKTRICRDKYRIHHEFSLEIKIS